MIHYFFIFLFFLFSEKDFASTNLGRNIQNEDWYHFNPQQSHWITTFTFEHLAYEVPYDFSGQKKTINDKAIDNWGVRTGIGREFYLGKGFNTSTNIESFYLGTLFAKDSKVKSSLSTDDAYIKKTSNLWGLEINQRFGFQFEIKTKNPIFGETMSFKLEPFIEAGAGRAWAYNRVKYVYQKDIEENYQHVLSDDLMHTKFGGGLVVTSTSGYFLFLRIMQTQFKALKRKSSISVQFAGEDKTTSGSEDKDLSLGPIMNYSLGGGLKF